MTGPMTSTVDAYGNVTYSDVGPSAATGVSTSTVQPMAPSSPPDLATTRSAYLAAMVAVQDALKTGDSAQTQSASVAYEAARTTYLAALTAAQSAQKQRRLCESPLRCDHTRGHGSSFRKRT